VTTDSCIEVQFSAKITQRICFSLIATIAECCKNIFLQIIFLNEKTPAKLRTINADKNSSTE
jgi:hypothetical protein